MEWIYTDFTKTKRDDISVMDLEEKIKMEVEILQHYSSEVYMRKICDNKAAIITEVKSPVEFPSEHIFGNICDTIESDVIQMENAIAAYPNGEMPPRDLRSICMNAKDTVKKFRNRIDLIDKFYKVP